MNALVGGATHRRIRVSTMEAANAMTSMAAARRANRFNKDVRGVVFWRIIVDA
jgi:hypothetical protein